MGRPRKYFWVWYYPDKLSRMYFLANWTLSVKEAKSMFREMPRMIGYPEPILGKLSGVTFDSDTREIQNG